MNRLPAMLLTLVVSCAPPLPSDISPPVERQSPTRTRPVEERLLSGTFSGQGTCHFENSFGNGDSTTSSAQQTVTLLPNGVPVWAAVGQTFFFNGDKVSSQSTVVNVAETANGSIVTMDLSIRIRILTVQEAISDEAVNAIISRGTDAILNRQRACQQNVQENMAARGISDSGLSFAAAQACGEAAARDIAAIRRDAFLQQELARSTVETEVVMTGTRVEAYEVIANGTALVFASEEFISGFTETGSVSAAAGCQGVFPRQ